MKYYTIIVKIMLVLLIAGEISAQDTQKNIISEYGYKGSFAVLDLKSGEFSYINKDRCSERYLPASTFKIPNSIIALETGVATGKDFMLKWDGVVRSFEAHNQDQTLQTAMKYSALWYFQELARRIGKETSQKYLNDFQYGNMKIGDAVDMYWVDGSLQISQLEQIEFLRKLYQNELKVSERTTEIVKEITTLEEDKETDFRLMAKTGWGNFNDLNYGWFVGICEYKGRTAVFALNIETADPVPGTFLQDRIVMSKKILSDLNYYPKDKLSK